jgi:hypothetical protein
MSAHDLGGPDGASGAFARDFDALWRRTEMLAPDCAARQGGGSASTRATRA